MLLGCGFSHLQQVIFSGIFFTILSFRCEFPAVILPLYFFPPRAALLLRVLGNNSGKVE